MHVCVCMCVCVCVRACVRACARARARARACVLSCMHGSGHTCISMYVPAYALMPICSSTNVEKTTEIKLNI